MPKRLGYIYEQVCTVENCRRAVLCGTENLRRTKYVADIRDNPDKYAETILKILQDGWNPSPCRFKTINEGTERKVRELRIPTMIDHLIHVAIILPIENELIKRFDFYSCGSIPGRGQIRAHRAIRGWMRRAPRYGAETDIRKFYDTCSKAVVMSALRRFIKDEKYLQLNEMILDQMGGVLAIGFMPSHWYANLVLSDLDREIRAAYPKIKFVRYMDNYLMLAGRKRTLHKAIKLEQKFLSERGMELKGDWQVYQTAHRPPRFLSYRYYRGYCLVRKKLAYRISRSARRMKRKPCAHFGRSLMSEVGILRHCNSYNFRKRYIYPVVSLKMTRRIISNADKQRLLHGRTCTLRDSAVREKGCG